MTYLFPPKPGYGVWDGDEEVARFNGDPVQAFMDAVSFANWFDAEHGGSVVIRPAGVSPSTPADEATRQTAIAAAERYLSSHEIPETEPPFPWLYLVAVLFIVAVLVAVCALSWDAIAAGVAFLAMSSAAGSSLVAEAGRDAGVVR